MRLPWILTSKLPKILSINLIIDKNSNFALVCQGTLGLNELDSSDMSVQFLEMCLPTMQPPLVSLAF